MALEEYAKKRFLIVDKLDTFCFSTKKTLKELGLKLVDTANSAQKVITGFENINYDVVLCNYDLGKGKNGQELLEELRYRKLLKFTGLFFIVSAEVEKDKVMGTVENEPDGYLVKPVIPKDLINRLKKSLKMKDAMRQIEAAIDEGDYLSAIQYCDRKIAEKDPYTSRAFKTKAWLYGKTGQLDLAKAIYEGILSQQDYLWAEYGLAKTFFKLKDYPQAESSLKRILEKDPEQLEALDLLAEISKKQQNYVAAQAYLKKAITLSPNALLRQKELAEVCVLNKDDKDAFEAFKKMHKLSEQSVYAKPEQYFDYANFLIDQAKKHPKTALNTSQTKQAFELTESIKKRFSTHPNIQDQSKLATAHIHLSLGNEEEAQALIDSVLKEEHINDLDTRTLKIASSVIKASGNTKLAEQLLEKAADKAENDPSLIAEIYEQLNRDITTEERKEAALKNKAGIQHYTNNELEQAVAILHQALVITPRHISLNLNLIQVLLKLYKQTKDEFHLNEVNALLKKIRHIPEDHKEHRRYQFLNKKLANERK
jgi:tetratricopeptide (TPR) repeat protein